MRGATDISSVSEKARTEPRQHSLEGGTRATEGHRDAASLVLAPVLQRIGACRRLSTDIRPVYQSSAGSWHKSCNYSILEPKVDRPDSARH